MDAVRDSATPPPTYWGDHDLSPMTRLVPSWVATTWLACLALTFAIAAIATVLVAAFSDSPLTGATNTDLGVLTIIGAMSTFIGFSTMLAARLVRVDHDRFVNSLAVAVLHVGIAVVLFAIELALHSAGMGASDLLDGNGTDEIGNAFTMLERSAAAAFVAALLATGMVPARGDRPTGTQVGATPQDRQL